MKRFLGVILLITMLFSIVACDIPGGSIGGSDNDDDWDGNLGGITGSDPDDDNDENDNPSNDNGSNDSGSNDNNPDSKPEPTPDIDPSPNKVTVYLLNSADWAEVALYYWGSRGEINGGWPGTRLSLGDDGLYRATIDKQYSMLIFNNNHKGAQTPDLSMPSGDRIVYDNVNNCWLTYGEAIAILDGSEDVNPEPDTSPVTVYLLNRLNWDQVAAYCWSWKNQVETEGGWPGDFLFANEDGLYKLVIDRKFDSFVFNNGSDDSKTVDLTFPDGDRIVYDNQYNFWITYDEAIRIINSDDGHEHDFVEGKCECGETDPNYTPDVPHQHSFVEGKCECGETDPNYTPDAPHQHSFVEGKCECGETDPNYTPDAPHQHNFVEGKCECGETDPNYTPDVPHQHNFVEGKCECGETDPNYTPNIPEISEELALFYDLFDYNNHISVNLKISNSELQKIQRDYEKYSSMGSKSPIYRMADLVITITKPDGTSNQYVIEQVGVRMKGNTSRTSFYSSSSGMYNLIHFKISFQETFDDVDYYGSDALTWSDSAARKARKNRTFATLEKIDMRWNRNDDTTYIRESYAYDLYREFGVLAPHTNLASVDIGKDHAGVWVIYEPVDKIFLEKNLPEEALGGDLYKLGWTSEGATFTSFSSYGVEDEDACKFYTYDLKTNKKTSTHASLKNLINSIKSSSATKATFESLVDMENFLYYCAVSYMIGNPDDLRNNYNNSYIYFRADTGKMIVIPYDMDRGLGVNTWNPTGHGMTKEDPFNKKALGNGDQRSPLFLKTVCTGGFFISEYTAALKEVDASKMLTKANFEAAFNLAASLYSGNASTSKTYNNANGYKFRFDINRTCNPGDSKNMSFADYITAKRATLYKSIGDQGNTDNSGGSSDSGGNSGNQNQGVNSKPYIAGDMNGWQVNSQYAMKSNGDGTFSFTVTTAHVSSTYNRIKFKIYDNNSGVWYGYEIVDPSCTVNCNDITNNSNGNKNIYLAPGTYLLTFDANTVTLFVEKIG